MGLQASIFKTRHLLVISALLLFAAPFIVISFFNYPGAEDYAEVVIVQELGFIDYVKELYINWDGRFFSAMLFGIHPLNFHSFTIYKIVPIFLFVGLFLGIYLVLNNIDVFKRQKGLVLLGSVCLYVLFLYAIPNTAYSFYYYISSTIYIVPVIGSLFLAACVLRFNKTESKKRKLLLLCISCFLIFATIGGLEMFLILIPFGLLLNLIYNISIKSSSIKGAVILVFASISASIIHITSPGISSHLYQEGTVLFSFEHFFEAILSCVGYTNAMLISFIKSSYLILPLLFIYIAILTHLEFNLVKKISFIKLTLLIGAIIMLVHLLALPYYWSFKPSSVLDVPERVYNVVYIYFIISWFLIPHLIYLYLVPRIKTEKILSLNKLVYLSVFFIVINTPLSDNGKMLKMIY